MGNILQTWATGIGGTEYLLLVVFILIFIIAFIVDILFIGRNARAITTKTALLQTLGFVSLAVLYGALMYFTYTTNDSPRVAAKNITEYFSAYLMEYSLSTDNIFVFVLILSYFKVSNSYQAKVLFWGVLFAIIFRLIFIYTGIWIVSRFHWVLYIFGAILIYTGIRMVLNKDDHELNPDTNAVYRFLNKRLRFTTEEAHGKFMLRREGKVYYTMLMMVVIILATTDLVFALDSIPAVFAISQQKIVIVTSNVFAVLGLRSLFFVLRNAVNRFAYLPQGISAILIFIGVKMLLDIIHIEINAQISLLVIVGLLSGSIVLSVVTSKNVS